MVNGNAQMITSIDTICQILYVKLQRKLIQRIKTFLVLQKLEIVHKILRVLKVFNRLVQFKFHLKTELVVQDPGTVLHRHLRIKRFCDSKIFDRYYYSLLVSFNAKLSKYSCVNNCLQQSFLIFFNTSQTNELLQISSDHLQSNLNYK